MYDQTPDLLQAVLRAVALMKEALEVLDAAQCNSAGTAMLDHAIHTLEADYGLRGHEDPNSAPD